MVRGRGDSLPDVAFSHFVFCWYCFIIPHGTKLGGYAGIAMSGCLVHVWNESRMWQEAGMLGLSGCNSITSETGTGDGTTATTKK